jgi:hypothetical protein
MLNFGKLCFRKTGDGFLSGQGIALIAACNKSFKNGEAGNRTNDFLNRLRKESLAKGLQMASWGLLNSIAQRLLGNAIETERTRRLVAGGLVSAILAGRNGPGLILRAGIAGFAQTLLMDCLANCVEIALHPLDVDIDPYLIKERNEELFKGNPINVILSAFSSQ